MKDQPKLEVVGGDPEVERKALLGDYEPEKFKEEMGVDPNAMISPEKPKPQIMDGSCMKVLTHEGVFSPPECARIIADNRDADWDDSKITQTENSDERHLDLEYRKSSQAWIGQTKENLWLFDKMLALIMSANKDFQFEIDFFEALQLVKYEVGEFYDWHIDMGPQHMGNRKLSTTVQLSSPEDYEGGSVVLDNNGKEFVAPKALGSVTVFPSFMKHKVEPVTKGTRYSLVVWCSGTNRFR